jgi:hypothetical protein
VLDPSAIPIVQDRIEPVMLIDAKDGKYKIPVVVISDFQYQQLLGDLKTLILAALSPVLPSHIAPQPNPAPEQPLLPFSPPLSFTDSASSATTLE